MRNGWTVRAACALAAAAIAVLGMPRMAAAYHEKDGERPDHTWTEEDRRAYAETHRDSQTDAGRTASQSAQAEEVPDVPEPPPLPEPSLPSGAQSYDCPPDEIPEDVGGTALETVDEVEQTFEGESGQELPADPDGEIANALGCQSGSTGDPDPDPDPGNGAGGGDNTGVATVLGAVQTNPGELPRTGPALPAPALGAALLSIGLLLTRKVAAW